ncbi:MAG: hypothetical protein CMF26_00545 [Kiloniella sp.]|nr:hypothetical protein [Kiloniella sp.]
MVLFDLTLHGAGDELTALNRRLDGLAAFYRWPARAHAALQVGLDEWISNILEHGHPDTSKQASIRVVLAVDRVAEPSLIFARVEDRGRSFDPTRQCSGRLPQPTAGLGCGLRLMRHLCSGLHYQQRGGLNQLRLEVRT